MNSSTENTVSKLERDDDVPAVVFDKPLVLTKDNTLAPRKKPQRVTLTDVIEEWREEGRLVHEPTGLPELDRITGGGPTYGIRAFIVGAPDAAKTLFIAQTADLWIRRGIAVAILSIDEEVGDLATRFAQRVGFSRSDCEIRDHATLDRMADKVRDLPLIMYRDPETTIEDAAEDLRDYMREQGIEHGALFVDSVQTVMCRLLTDGRERSERQTITANVKAIRAMAIAHKLIVWGTSETSRTFYKANEEVDKLDKMASAKESGAVEYAARLLIFISIMRDNPDLLKADVAKNKLGQRSVLYWRIDRARQVLEDADAPGSANLEKVSNDFIAKCAHVQQMVIDHPGMGTRDRRAAIGALKANNVKITLAEADACLLHLVKEKKIESRLHKPPTGKECEAYFPLVNVVITPPPPPPAGMAHDDGTDPLRDYVES